MQNGVLNGYGTPFYLFNYSGVYIWSNGSIYRGEWAEGKMDGFGEFRWISGDFYVGEYKDD